MEPTRATIAKQGIVIYINGMEFESPFYCRPLCSKEADCDLSGPYPEVCGIRLQDRRHRLILSRLYPDFQLPIQLSLPAMSHGM